MAEFKVSSGLEGEISSLSSAGSAISTSTVSLSGSYVDTLDTAVKYQEQQEKLRKVMKLYQQLIVKDAKDLEAMRKTAEAMDEAIAAKTRE